jgi:uncharacterized protein (DUF1330 family)
VGCLHAVQQDNSTAPKGGRRNDPAGNVEGAAYGDPKAKRWEFVVLVRYPSRKAFLKMVTSPEYAQANVHRENGVDDHVILASTETYSKFPPPKA